MPNVAKSGAFFEPENSPPPSPGIDGTGRGGTRRRWPPRSSPRDAPGAALRCTRARDTGVLRSPISTVVECSPSRPPAMRVRPSLHAYWYPCWEERRPIAREGLRTAREGGLMLLAAGGARGQAGGAPRGGSSARCQPCRPLPHRADPTRSGALLSRRGDACGCEATAHLHTGRRRPVAQVRGSDGGRRQTAAHQGERAAGWVGLGKWSAGRAREHPGSWRGKRERGGVWQQVDQRGAVMHRAFGVLCSNWGHCAAWGGQWR